MLGMCYYGLLGGLLCTTLFKAIIAVSEEDAQLQFSQNSADFASDLYFAIGKTKSDENFVLSPFSVQMCGAMLYSGAGGQTAVELAWGLRLLENDINKIPSSFQTVLKEHQNFLDIANKIYLKNGLQINPGFREIVSQNFFSEEGYIDSSQDSHPEDAINSWVASVTHNKIKDILPESFIDPNTNILLVNSLYFKAEWETPLTESTNKFLVSENEYPGIDSQDQNEYHQYCEIDWLDSKVLELPFKDSNISMLFILPNKYNQLQQRIASVDLLGISKVLKRTRVNVQIPNFKIEFLVDFTDILSKMGIKSLFTTDADFSKMLPGAKAKIDKVIQKVFIHVNNLGTEAGAATGDFAIPPSLPSIDKGFVADHPFFFAIKSKTAVFFVGSYQQ